MFRQGGLDDNHMGSLGQIDRHHLPLDPVGPLTGGSRAWHNRQQAQQRSDCEWYLPLLTRPGYDDRFPLQASSDERGL